MPTTKLPLLLLLLAATVGQACLSPLTADNVTALGRSWGLVYQGVAAGSKVGARVQTAGDVNGDGFEDFLVATATSIGDVFLVFGRADFEAASLVLTTEDSTPDAADWVKFEGNAGVSITTTSFTSGDFNGDGLSDIALIITKASVDINTVDVYIFHGHTGAWESLKLSLLDSFGDRKVSIKENCVSFVGNAGDMNGDGKEDLLITQLEQLGVSAYLVWVVFGGGADLIVENVDGLTGFKISVPTMGTSLGTHGDAGDVNGDGLDDLVFGTATQHTAFVIYARNVSVVGNWQSTVTISTVADMPSSLGFSITTNYVLTYTNLGYAATGAGDLNGDGFDDIFLGTGPTSNRACVIFGGPAQTAANIVISTSNSFNGFVLVGHSSDASGTSGGACGDMNGDGFDDLLVGAYGADSAYVLWGHSGTWPESIDRDDVTGNAGFQLEGPSGSEFGISAHTAGDVNGDGFADIVVGAQSFNVNVGMALLVFGQNDHCEICDGICQKCEVGFELSGVECIPSPAFSSSSPQSTPLSDDGSGSNHNAASSNSTSTSTSTSTSSTSTSVIVIEFGTPVIVTELLAELIQLAGSDVIIQVVEVTNGTFEITTTDAELLLQLLEMCMEQL